MRRRLSSGLLIVAAGGFAYANSLANGFTFDDPLVILNNPHLQSLSFSGLLLSPYPIGDLYRPVVMLSYGLNVLIHGFDPLGFHVVNVVLHVCVSLLVHQIVLAMSGRQTLASISALLFTLHPIHTEAVSGVVGRAELLAGVFGLASLYTYQLQGSWGETLRPRALGALSLVLLALAAHAKESALALIGVYPLYRLLFGSRETKLRNAFSWHFAGSLVVVGLTLGLRAAVVGRLLAGESVRFLDNPIVQAGFLTRLATAVKVLGDYLSLLFFPLTLSADYSYRQVQAVSHPFQWDVLPPALLLLLLLAWAVFSWTRGDRKIAFGLLFFFSALSVTSNILFPIGTIKAERLLYLPSFGYCLVLAVGLTSLSRRGVGAAALATVLLFYGWRTTLRNPDWTSNEVLFPKTVAVSGQSAKVHFNMGVVHEKQGKWDDAALEYRSALLIYPPYEEAAVALGKSYERKRNWRVAHHWYQNVVRMNPNSVEARLGLGRTLLETGRPPEALREFRSALMLDSSSSPARIGIALSYLRMEKREDARAILREVEASRDPLIKQLAAQLRGM